MPTGRYVCEQAMNYIFNKLSYLDLEF